MDSRDALQLAKMKNSSREMREYAFKMEAVKKNLSVPADKEKKLRASCEAFESVFIQKMWEQMRATVPDGGMLKGREEKFWQGMYDQELSKSMASAGGIGLADMMYEQLSRTLGDAGKKTADAVALGPSPFAADLTPAPLARTAPPAAPDADARAGNEKAGNPARTAASGARGGETAALYSEITGPDAAHEQEEASRRGDAPLPAETEAERNPAIAAALEALRSGARAAPPPAASLSAPEQNAGPQGVNLISTLSRPVTKPPSGKRTVLPRSGGPRVPAGRPVHRNLPFAEPQTRQAPLTDGLSRANGGAAGADTPRSAAAGYALNADAPGFTGIRAVSDDG
jgi:Rod binding domain-containing protein